MIVELPANTFLDLVVVGTGAAGRSVLRCDDVTAGDGLAPFTRWNVPTIAKVLPQGGTCNSWRPCLLEAAADGLRLRPRDPAFLYDAGTSGCRWDAGA